MFSVMLLFRVLITVALPFHHGDSYDAACFHPHLLSYGWPLLLDTKQSTSTFCTSCFDEVCARCANRVNGVPNGDQVQIDGIPLCTGAPSGVTASSKGTTLATLTLDKGYYRTSKTSHDVHECYNEDACVGGNDTDKYCASGYQGPCEDKVEVYLNILKYYKYW